MYFLQDSLFLSVVSLSGQRHDIMAFYLLSCHACCKWHWPIRKHLDLWIHLRSLPCAFSRRSVNQPIVWFLNAATTPCWRDPNTSKQLSTTVAILGFQFWLYHVVVTLSFLRSNQLCFIAMWTIIPFSGLLGAKPFLKALRLGTRLNEHILGNGVHIKGKEKCRNADLNSFSLITESCVNIVD